MVKIIKKTFVNLFIILFLSVVCAGCEFDGGLRKYNMGFTINDTYAKKLVNCTKYKTPAGLYIGNQPPYIDRYYSEIIGYNNNKCIIRNYGRSGLVALPMDFTKDLSYLFQSAFKEPKYLEVSTYQEAINFCKKYPVFEKYHIESYENLRTFNDVMMLISNYMYEEYAVKKY